MKVPACLRGGFTLVELLVGITISVILIGIMLSVMSQINSTVRTVDSKIDAFQNAEASFDLMTQKLSDATLNTYYGYDSATSPTQYLRRSDLHFLVEQNSNLTATVFPTSTSTAAANANSGQSIFFQAPSGYSDNALYANTTGLLNACGYFIEFGPNQPYWPTIFGTNGIAVHYRYRLMQSIQSTEFNNIYGDTETKATPEGGSNGTTAGAFPAAPWFQSLGASAVPIAENVVALIVWPQSPAITTPSVISPDYQYSSRQGFPLSTSATATQIAQSEQLPQVLQITLVAIDAASATRLDNGTGTPPLVIENAIKNKFTTATAAQYTADLGAMESALTAANIHYEVLTTSVTLRESKWSNGQ